MIEFNEAAENLLKAYRQECKEKIAQACDRGSVMFVSSQNKQEKSTKRSLTSSDEHSGKLFL